MGSVQQGWFANQHGRGVRNREGMVHAERAEVNGEGWAVRVNERVCASAVPLLQLLPRSRRVLKVGHLIRSCGSDIAQHLLI